MNNPTRAHRIAKLLLCAGIVWLGAFQISSQPARIAHASALSAVSPDTPAPEPLRRFAADTIQQLAANAPFTGWSAAKPIIEPLGPGTHSWLVTLSSGTSTSKAPLGYLIISATPEGDYKLVEYGLGENSLYAKPTLESGLAGLGFTAKAKSLPTVTPVYAGPVLAEWMVRAAGKSGSVHFIDALTGERLPESLQSWNKQAASYVPPSSAAGSAQKSLAAAATTRHADPFDPYDNILWMAGEPIQSETNRFDELLAVYKRLVFVTNGPDRTYSIPLPITGYQKWSADPQSSGEDAIYVLTGSDSSQRWIALDALKQSGKFVAYTD
ncbi:hypothetical protein QYF50_15710 [Paenibacillus vini]|uniref:hypothetical protein n=1 Tax=Paenibacillus vini TaxID=1476024 RepID=UPI0025B64E2C|nr:hypothetical protein [Paenibacillus vini]MDN4069352.1 hypothetical protein [Paenibacillus vini]